MRHSACPLLPRKYPALRRWCALSEWHDGGLHLTCVQRQRARQATVFTRQHQSRRRTGALRSTTSVSALEIFPGCHADLLNGSGLAAWAGGRASSGGGGELNTARLFAVVGDRASRLEIRVRVYRASPEESRDPPPLARIWHVSTCPTFQARST